MEFRDLSLPRKKTLVLAMSGVLGLLSALPACAETEIEALKRELAEQKALIQSILSAQEAQKKLEIQTGGPSRGAGLQAGVPTGQPTPALTIYGVADVSYSNVNSGQGYKSNFGSGGYSSSRLGFKGEKALDDDLSAVYLMEAGLLFNTGTVGGGQVTPGINNKAISSGGQTDTGAQVFSRQMYAGLKSGKFGQMTVGRQYAGSYLAAVTGNSMGAGLYGTSVGFLPTGGMPTRLNNSLVYVSPKFNGFYTYITLTTGNENNVNTPTPVAEGSKTLTNDQAGRGGDFALFYGNGSPLNAAFTTWSINNATYDTAKGENGLARRTGWQLSANYDFGPAKLYGSYTSGRIAGGNYENGTAAYSKSTGWSVSAGVPFGKSQAYLSYTHFDDKSPANKDGNLIGLAYTYKFIESTLFYASWGKMINNEKASYSLTDGGNLVGNVLTKGFDPSGFMLGVNHVF